MRNNMTTDRTELTSLAAKHPQRVQTMVKQWETWARRAHVLPWIWTPAYGEALSGAPKGKTRKRVN